MQYSALGRAGHSKGQLLASEVPSLLLHAVCSATRVDCHWRERPKHQNRQVLLLFERCTNIICLSESKLSVDSKARTRNSSLRRKKL